MSTDSSKYLFNELISIEGHEVNIQEVKKFQQTNNDDINIIFTTIQTLTEIISEPKENSLSIKDFSKSKTILLADEGHHLNSESKAKRTKKEDKNIKNWERITRKIFNANEENYLLEFTATAGIKENSKLRAKYNDKLLFDYPIKSFHKDKYSKEIYLLLSDIPNIDRAILAILLSQYRKNIFTDELKQNFKPVILFKSKINDDCDKFYQEFTNKINTLDVDYIRKLKDQKTTKNPLLDSVFQYFEKKDATLKNLVLDMKREFSKEKCIKIHSDIKEKNKIPTILLKLNNLEDYRNPIRVVFATDMLNEGWDVKNLYDIVRLYSTNETKEVTQEAQLIGRGARYYPFEIDNTHEYAKYQRKFDGQAKHPLKICEELYYHSPQNRDYIKDLKKEFEKEGRSIDDPIHEINLKLKPTFTETNFYKTKSIYTNKQVEVKKEKISGIKDYFETTPEFYVKVHSNDVRIEKITENEDSIENENQSVFYLIKDFDKRVVYYVFNRKRLFYRFDNLLKYFPNLDSKTTFIESRDYLGDISICFEGKQYDVNHLTIENKVKGLEIVSNEIEKIIIQKHRLYKGSKKFSKKEIKDVFRNKTFYTSDRKKTIGQSEDLNSDLHLDIPNKDWYVFNDNFGTDQEKYLVKFICKAYQKLKEKFDEIYLIRNEEFFKIYDFENGKGFCPDFVLFLIKGKTPIHLQIFIEPKGKHLIEYDRWKNDFLLDVKPECITIEDNAEYKIWGLPFFNNPETKRDFKNSFDEIVNHSL